MGQEGVDTTALLPALAVNYGVYFPGGDMVHRFGVNMGAGGSFSLFTPRLWSFHAEGVYLFGDRVKETHILDGITTSGGMLILPDGTLEAPRFSERGFTIMLYASRQLWNTGPTRFSGVVMKAGGGVFQHRIRIENNLTQLLGDYQKGYDRLTNGPAAGFFAGYRFFSRNRLITFQAGMYYILAWTRNRRTYNFDEMKRDARDRLDILTGIQLSWFIPFFKRIPDEYYFF